MALNAYRIKGCPPYLAGEGTPLQRLLPNSLPCGERVGVRECKPGGAAVARNNAFLYCVLEV